MASRSSSVRGIATEFGAQGLEFAEPTGGNPSRRTPTIPFGLNVGSKLRTNRSPKSVEIVVRRAAPSERAVTAPLHRLPLSSSPGRSSGAAACEVEPARRQMRPSGLQKKTNTRPRSTGLLCPCAYHSQARGDISTKGEKEHNGRQDINDSG